VEVTVLLVAAFVLVVQALFPLDVVAVAVVSLVPFVRVVQALATV
jgi:hypothetical protein